MNGRDRQPSPGYLLTLSLSMAGITASAIGLGAALRAGAGGDPTNALQAEGPVALVGALSLGFLYRLIFWGKASAKLQSAVRVLMAGVIGCGVVAALLAVAFTVRAASPAGGTRLILPITFSGLAAVCQIAAAFWLIRFRSE